MEGRIWARLDGCNNGPNAIDSNCCGRYAKFSVRKSNMISDGTTDCDESARSVVKDVIGGGGKLR